MVSTDNFCLRLNEFEKNIKTSWKELQEESDFCDVTLACEQKKIKTHKLIISACSPVLRNQNPHPLIYLRRVKYRDLQNLLNFMYQGEVNVAEEDLPSFLELAEDLNVKGLSEGNKGTHDSNEKVTSPKKYFDPSQKKSETVKNKNLLNINAYNLVGTTSKDEQTDKTFINNDDHGLFVPDEYDDNNFENTNIISTSAANETVISHQCEQCDYKTKYSFDLNKHVKSIHEGVRYPCELCDYKATQKGNLRTHKLKRHSNY